MSITVTLLYVTHPGFVNFITASFYLETPFTHLAHRSLAASLWQPSIYSLYLSPDFGGYFCFCFVFISHTRVRSYRICRLSF